MDGSVVTSITVGDTKARMTSRGSEHMASISQLLSDIGSFDRIAPALSVRRNAVESSSLQQVMSNGNEGVSNYGMHGDSFVDAQTATATIMRDNDMEKNGSALESFELPRSGSLPGGILENLESLLDCTLNVTNNRRALESKDSAHLSMQRTSRFVEVMSHTSTRRNRTQSSTRIGDSSKELNTARWMMFIRELRQKKFEELLSKNVNRDVSSDLLADEGKPSHINQGTMRGSSVSREIDVHLQISDETVFRSLSKSRQYARFRPRSVVRSNKNRPLTPIGRASIELTSYSIFNKTNRASEDATNYGLVRIRETGAHRQVYDCVEKETGRKLSVKLISKDHLAAVMYKQLCKVPHKNIERIVQVLEDKRLLYILMDFNNSQYLRDFYYNSQPRTLTHQIIRTIVKDILEALAFLHKKGIVHGGIDMDSITIHRLKDRGILTKLANVDTVYTTKCQLKEQPLERICDAPEKADGVVTCSSDLWNLGILLYTLCEGRSPYRRFTLKKNTDKLTNLSPSDVTFTSDQWIKSPGMKDFCLRCLQPNHSCRITSAMEGLIHYWFSN